MGRDMGGMRGGGNSHQGGIGMKRRWDSAGGGSDLGPPKRSPYQANFSSHSMNGSSSNVGYQPKPFRPSSYDQNKPAMSSAPPSYPQSGYGKFASYAPMQMPPTTLSTYSPIATAIANYTFPPPSSIMPPLPKN